MKEILAGTYWLIANGDGSRAICKGKKPKEIGKSAWVIERPEMGWITLDNDIHVRAKYRDKIINKSDFQGLVFPKISYDFYVVLVFLVIPLHLFRKFLGFS